jgi:hypothetical protein
MSAISTLFVQYPVSPIVAAVASIQSVVGSGGAEGACARGARLARGNDADEPEDEQKGCGPAPESAAPGFPLDQPERENPLRHVANVD